LQNQKRKIAGTPVQGREREMFFQINTPSFKPKPLHFGTLVVSVSPYFFFLSGLFLAGDFLAFFLTFGLILFATGICFSPKYITIIILIYFNCMLMGGQADCFPKMLLLILA